MMTWRQRVRRLLTDEGGFWTMLIPVAASLIGGMISGSKAKKAASHASGGARLQQLMPQITQMIQQQQQVAQQNFGQSQERYRTNYGNQVQHAQANQPLQDAVRRMAQGVLPTRYQ